MGITAQMETAELITRGRHALERAKKQEKKKLSTGYKYITLNDRTRILVECDKDGNPTERGQRQLDAAKSKL